MNSKIHDTALPVRVRDLSFSYNGKQDVLSNVAFSLEAGDRLGIIGPSGAGKSTLLLHLNGILRDRGSVEIGDIVVTESNLGEIRRRVGLVFQNPDDQLFTPSVEEDVAFGPLNMGLSPAEAAVRVEQILDPLHLKGFNQKSTHQLSFGERKRVALATVLAMQPSVLAFDEPFSNLDPHLVKHLITIINRLHTTTIIISQSIIPVLACCDKLAILNEGRIIACDSVAAIAADRELLKSCNLDFHYYLDICRNLLS